LENVRKKPNNFFILKAEEEREKEEDTDRWDAFPLLGQNMLVV